MQGGIGGSSSSSSGSSSSSSSQGAKSEQASCCDPAAPCEVPCGRLTEFWDPELLLELSHHPAVERCHALGGYILLRLPKPQDTCACQGLGSARQVMQVLAE